MANQKFSLNLNGKFAEKCRRALEKSWDIEIPTPKFPNIKAKMQKKPR
jgi:hypothetical protein